MIFLDYLYEVGNWSSGMDEALTDTVSTNPTFIIMFLIFVFSVVFISGITSQKRRTGTADFPMWATISSMSVMMISLSLTLVEGLIQIETLSIIAVITIFSGFWLFMDKKRGEM